MKTIFFALVLCAVVTLGTSLTCYLCSSCNVTTSSTYQKTCNLDPITQRPQYPKCLTLKYIANNQVWRGCIVVGSPDTDPCLDSDPLQISYCNSCSTDLCNNEDCSDPNNCHNV